MGLREFFHAKTSVRGGKSTASPGLIRRQRINGALRPIPQKFLRRAQTQLHLYGGYDTTITLKIAVLYPDEQWVTKCRFVRCHGTVRITTFSVQELLL